MSDEIRQEEEEECCLSDALLADVVELAEAAYQNICSPERDHKRAFIDGYIACYNADHFPRRQEEETERCALLSSYGL